MTNACGLLPIEIRKHATTNEAMKYWSTGISMKQFSLKLVKLSYLGKDVEVPDPRDSK
jgi:hypothetical protein